VKLSSFTATQTGGGTQLNWETGYEVNNLGFNLYREDNGQRVQVNPSLIAGTAFVAGAGTPMTAGFTYSWFDPQGTASSLYTLEDIDLDGTHTTHGPVAPVADNASAKAGRQAALLSELSGTSAVIERGGPAYFGRPQISSIQTKATGSNASAENSPANPLAAQAAVKLSVRRDGWYRADLADLVAAGLNPAASPLTLSLYADGVEQAISVFNNTGRADGGGYIEFYGLGLDMPSTDTRTYWLVSGSRHGKRITTIETNEASPQTQPKPVVVTVPHPTSITREPGFIYFPFIYIFRDPPKDVMPKPKPSEADKPAETPAPTVAPATVAPVAAEPTAKPKPKPKPKKKKAARKAKARRLDLNKQKHHPDGSNTNPTSFAYTVERKERALYFSALLNGDAENFFGKILASTPVDQTLTVRHLDTASTSSAQLQVVLQGGTAQAHQVLVQLNGTDVGMLNYAGMVNADQVLNISPATLREGDNTIRLIAQGGSADVSLVDRLKLTYARLYRAENNRLNFSASGASTVNVEGFTSAGVRVLDITNPNEVIEIEPQVRAQGGGYTITVGPGTGGGTRNLLAFASDQFERPAAMASNHVSSLSQTTNGADFLIITDGRFRASVKSLASLRAGQGMAVSVVDVEDIYDEFSYGAHSPQAIKDFLAWTMARWQKAPRYVLLVGDGSYDPRNYQGKGQFDLIPTKMVDTRYMETAGDDWYADFNNDGVAEMAVGRLPVRTLAEANAIISKIVNYRPPENSSARGVLLVSDRVGPDGYDFEATSNELKALVPAGVTVQSIVRHDEDGATMRGQILNGLSQGPLVANYAGHGTYDKWTGDGILRAMDAGQLANSGKTSLFVTMTCMNGYYVDANTDSLAEALLKAEGGGAIAVWASSGITLPTGQAEINQKLYQQIFGEQNLTLGEAVQRAKAATTDPDVRRTWILFGDPTMRIR